MPGTEGYEDPFMYIANPRQKSASRGRGRTSKGRNYGVAYYEGSSRPDTSFYRSEYGPKEEDAPPNRKRIKASHYENFIRKHPGGSKLCILCKLEDTQLNCQGVLKWFSVKSKRGPGRPKDNKLSKAPKLISSFLSMTQDMVVAPKVITLKTEAGTHAEAIKIKIDMSKSSATEMMPNGNGYRREEPDSIDSAGFYIHLECCRWTASVTSDIEMFKAERYLLKGLGQICAYCHMNGATVCCRFDGCKKKYHLVCGLLAHCVPDIGSATMICYEHLTGGGGPCGEVICSKCREDKCHKSMLHCFSCGSHTHQQCLPADVQMRPLVLAGWQCTNCRTCQGCHKPFLPNTSPGIDCSICSKPYHMTCIDPQQPPIQEQQWRCKTCKNCTDCGTEVPVTQVTTGFLLPFVLCKECYTLRMKGISCCVCYKAMTNEFESLRCENCKSLLHPACESIEPELIDPANNIYLCPVCRPGGKAPIINRTTYLSQITDNGQLMEPDTVDENSQDSMSIASENDEMSLTPVSSSHNSPGSSSVDSFYTVIPVKKGQRGLGIKLARPGVNRKLPKTSGEGSFQEKRDGVLPNEVVLYNESDQYTSNKDLCVMCGSIGAKEDGHLLTCQQCAKCYHAYCVQKTVTNTMLRIGWRCSDCLICEGCSKASDGARLLLCEDCDVSFHTYCLTPPLEVVPSGPWRCSWCVKCVKCKRTSPGLHATWYQDYTVCGPCQSQQTCLSISCGVEYSENDFTVKCSSCEQQFHGKCEDIASPDHMPKKFVCSLCEDLVKKEDKPSKKLQSQSSFGSTKQALNSVLNRDMRIAAYKQKDEKEFEAEREEQERKRIFGYEFVKALNKGRHEFQQKNKRQTSQDKDQKFNPILEQGLTPPKDLSNSQMYQQIIREITGSAQSNKMSSKRGRGRASVRNVSQGLLSPTKDPNAPRVRGRPRGSRNKTSTSRRGGVPGKGVHQEMLQHIAADDNLNFTDYTGIPRPALKSPHKTPLKRSNSNKGRGKQIPPIMDPNNMPEMSPAKMNSELAMNFFGEDLVPGSEMISPAQMLPPQQPMGPPMTIPPPALTSPVNNMAPPPHMNPMINQQKPPYNIQMKPPLKSHNIQMDPLKSTGHPVPRTPTPPVLLPSPKPPTPIKKEMQEPLDLSKINIDDVKLCPESPVVPQHPDSLPDYNNRELFNNKPAGVEVEEEEKTCEAVSSYFSALFGEEDLDLDEPAKGSPVYNPPDPNAEQLTLKNMEDIDEGIGELPSEVNAILESIEAKPMGTEIDDLEPWNEKNKDVAPDIPTTPLETDLEMADELLKGMEGFNFPEFFDDLTMKKLETEHRKTGPNDRSEFDKILEPPTTMMNKQRGKFATFKQWEEEEKKGKFGTVPQLLYACSNPEMNMLKVQVKDTMERFKIINKAYLKLSKDEKKIYVTNSKKNKLRKTEPEFAGHLEQPPGTPAGGWQQFDASRMIPQPDKIPMDDQEMLRQSQRERRQRLYERHPARHMTKPGEMMPGEQMMAGWPRFRTPDDGSGSTVTVGPIPPKGGIPPQMTAGRDTPMTPGPMTPGPMTPSSMQPGPMTPGPIRSPMTPRGMSPMQLMQQMQNPVMAPPGYMRHFDPSTGQWVHSGAHTPLRHLPPQAIMAQQNMGMSYMDQYNMQQTPDPPQPPAKPKKRTKKKKEKAPVVEPPTPMEPQVNLENFPPHLRFGGNQTEFQGAPTHGTFEYNEHFRQSMQMPGVPNPLTKNFKQGNSPHLKSPQTADMERPKSLNINNNSPSGAGKTDPPNKGLAKNCSPLTKTEDFSTDTVEAHQQQQQMQQKQTLRIALEQRKHQQSHFMSQQMMMPGNLHYPMNITQFVQFRMQQDWLKKFNNFKASGGALPQEPQHPNNIPPNQIHAIYSQLMEHVMFSMANSRMTMGHPAMMEQMGPVEEEKKPKAKKRKKKKTETPVKKDDKSKMPKMAPNLIMQTAMGPGPLKVHSPQQNPDNFMQHHMGAHPGFQQQMNPQMNPQQMGPGGPHLGIINPNQKHLNMRSPGPAMTAGPHVSHIPGQIQQQRLMAPQYAAAPLGNSDPRYVRAALPTQNHHFHDGYDIEPPRTPKPPSKSKAKTKSKESSQISAPKPGIVPMQADSPRCQQFDAPRYQHQIRIEDNQDFTEAKSPQSQRSQTPSSASTPTSKDPFENLPLTPSMCNNVDNAAKRRKRRTKAEMDELRAERESKGLPPIRPVSKSIPPVLQPDIGKMVDIVVRGTNSTTTHCKLSGSFGRGAIQNQRSYYRDLVDQIKQAKSAKEQQEAPDIEKEAAKLQKQQVAREQMEKLRASVSVHTPTVLTPQQEKMLCQKFGVTPQEAQQMYYYQQHQHMLALRNQQIKAYQMQEQMEKARPDSDKSKILEQIRMLQESREKNSLIRNSPAAMPNEKIKQEQNVNISVKQQSDSIQLIFQRPGEKMEKKEGEVEKPPVKLHKPMLELTKPVPPTNIKQEYNMKEIPSESNSPKELPFAITGPDFTPSLKQCNPPTDEKTTRVINLHKAFQMLSDLLGMKLKKDNLASLNELRVQNIIPGSLPQNLVCYNCIVALHPNKLKHIAPGRPYYGIKDEHGATFCSDSCLAQYYCKKFSSLRGEDERSAILHSEDISMCDPPPLKQHIPTRPPYVERSVNSPGKRRRESESWKYWRLEDLKLNMDHSHSEDNKHVLELFKKMHHENTLKTDAPDQRVCLLCGGVGDGAPNGSSRLLNYRKSTWIHANCALWSNDVHESRDGDLSNVPQICKRAQDTVCTHCNRIGATVLCCKTKCNAAYHFLCARHSKCALFANKTAYCPMHKNVSGRLCTDFTVRRRVVIEKDIQQLLSNEAFKEAGDKVRIGSLIFHHPGHILNNTLNFHSRNIIYPFDYSVTRIFWSTEKVHARTRYHCSVGIKDEAPLFKVSYVKQDKLVELEDSCCDSLWKDILHSVSQLRAKNSELLNLHTNFHPGTFLHGLTERNMLRIIEGLPGSDKLEGYTFCYGRIETVTLEHLVPFNPTQSARTEKYTKHTKRVGGHRQVSSVQGSQPPSMWSRELGAFHEMLPYQKSFNRASQYRRLKTEWKVNVLLRRSGIQGLGLYARRFIDRNTMVIEYVGQLIRTALCDSREVYYNAKNIGCYMFKIDDVVAVDATMTGGPARYINHSCEPNCVAEIVTFEREKKIIIISNRKIRQGEELTYDYKFDFEDDTEKIPCNCGSMMCRKWMN